MGISINNPIGSAIDFLKDVADRIIPDKSQAAQAKATLDQLKEQADSQEVQDAFQERMVGLQVVQAEAKGESWLQRNWRPITALTFAGLVVAHWFGFDAKNLSPADIAELFGLVKLCLGGYTIGRSGEKIAKIAAPAIKAALSK